MKIKDIYLKNFRSFEDCLIEFEDFYTAICGKNNSGKSNIIKAILNVLGPVSNRQRLNYHTDFPVWKPKSSKESIELTVRIQLDCKADIGLIKFLQVFLKDSKEDNEEFEIKDTQLKIQINLYSNAKDSSTEITVENKSVSDKYRVGEILRRIHFAQVIVFHNSTQPNSQFRRTNHGHLENLSTKAKESIEGKVIQINKE